MMIQTLSNHKYLFLLLWMKALNAAEREGLHNLNMFMHLEIMFFSRVMLWFFCAFHMKKKFISLREILLLLLLLFCFAFIFLKLIFDQK